MNWIWILWILLLLGTFGLGIYALRLHFKDKDSLENYPILHNYQSQYTFGFSEGHIVNQIKGKKRDAIEFIPRDVNYLKYFKENKDVPEKIRLWYDKNQREDLPEGTISGEKNIVKIYAQNPEDYPEKFKKTDEGRALMEMTKNKKIERTQLEILREESDLTAEFAREVREPISEDMKDVLVQRHRQALESVTKEREPRMGVPPYKSPSERYGG